MHAPILAAGGIIWRPIADSQAVEVLLAHRPRYADWSFPKGKLHKGETLLGAAVREVREETGMSVMVGHRMPAVGYRTSDGPKEVTYWTMQPTGGRFTPNAEVDRIRWVPMATAVEMLSYDHDRRLAQELVDQRPGVVRVVLVRHADAGRRGDFEGLDLARPLVDRGRQQAERLVGLLAGFGPTRVLSAPVLRCRQTVEPLALALNLPVREEAMFGENEFDEDPRPAVECIRAGLDSLEEVTVIASQGGVIPALMTSLYSPAGPESMTEVAAKAGAWALGRGPGGVRADYYPPPKK